MEGLAALGLAATIMQVVDFAGKVLREGKEILESGSTKHNASRELVASDLRLLNDKVKAFARPDPHLKGPLDQDSQVGILVLSIAFLTLTIVGIGESCKREQQIS